MNMDKFYLTLISLLVNTRGSEQSMQFRVILSSKYTCCNCDTVPISVCYGAINLLVLVDTSNFAPYVCHQAIAGEYEGQESTVPSSAITGGSVAAEQSYRTRQTLEPVVPVWVRLTLALFPFIL